MNASSLDRGFGRCVVRALGDSQSSFAALTSACQVLRKHGAVVKKYANRAIDRMKVHKAGSSTAAGRDRRGLLDADGIAAVGQLIQVWVSSYRAGCSVTYAVFRLAMCSWTRRAQRTRGTRCLRTHRRRSIAPRLRCTVASQPSWTEFS